MKKGLIILNGDSKAKNILQEKLRNKYWLWNGNALNNVFDVMKRLTWDFEMGETTGQSTDFARELLDTANRYVDYEYQYIRNLVEKVKQSNKASENHKSADILIVHGADRSMIQRLLGDFPFFELHVSWNKKSVNENYDAGNGRFFLGFDGKEDDTYDMNVDKNIDDIMSMVLFEVEKEEELA